MAAPVPFPSRALRLSGLVCPDCQHPDGFTENRTPRVIWFRCPSCGHRWVAEEPRARSTELEAQMSYRIGIVVVGTFRSTVDAEIAKSVLNAAGVDSLMRCSNARSPIELLVRAEDAAKAKDALNHPAALRQPT